MQSNLFFEVFLSEFFSLHVFISSILLKIERLIKTQKPDYIAASRFYILLT